MAEVVVKRIAKKSTYTIGKLYLDGVYVCDTLEDTDRGLVSSMSLGELAALKVKGKTAIPSGTYRLDLNTVSPKYSRKPDYACIGYKMPRVMGVPCYEGILIHPGNTDKDTEGCILVGQNKVMGKVINSRQCFFDLYNRLKALGGSHTIIIH